MTEERRTPDPVVIRQRDVDAQVEELARRLAALINGAGSEQRQSLREYALGLIREETEVGDSPPAGPTSANASSTNPLGMALLLGVVALPLTLLFAPVGLFMLAIATILGVWGVIALMFRRAPKAKVAG